MRVFNKTVLLTAITTLGLTQTGVIFADSLADYSAKLHSQFTDVPAIHTTELSHWLSDTNRMPPLLIDVREEREYAVSHLQGALLVESSPIAQLQQLGIPKNAPIVAYCSVGYRSALLVQELHRAGFVNIHNLEGSIFAWANENRPLVNAAGSTSGVHPYSMVWGRYLSLSKWRWQPEISAKP